MPNNLTLWARRLIGRPRHMPSRQTDVYPRMMQLGQPRGAPKRPAYKPTPRNLRYFANTPYARRAINAIKNSIAHLDWEIVVKPGNVVSDEHRRQMEIVENCFMQPNEDDSFSQLMEQIVEDICCGAGAIEQQLGGDATRPLWMWPVDGLSIQIYPLWTDATPDEPRYVQMVGYGSASGSFEIAQLRNDELIYVRPNPTTASPFGLGPLEVAFMSISRMLGVSEYAGNLSSNTSPGGAFWMGDVDSDAVQEFRRYWKNDIEGQGRMPILGGGDQDPKYIDLHPEGDNALYLKYQETLRREIAIGFDLSPQNLGVEHDINRNTSEVAEDRDIAQVISPYGMKIAKQFSREAIQQKLGFSQLEFRFKGLDRSDEMEQAEVFEREYKNNAITPNEYRHKRGMPLSQNPWADLLFADFQVAYQAARGVGIVEDTSLLPDPHQPNDKGRADAPASHISDRLDTTLPGRPSGTKPSGGLRRRSGTGSNLTRK